MYAPRRYLKMTIALFLTGFIFAATCTGTKKDISQGKRPEHRASDISNQKVSDGQILPPKKGCFVGVFPRWGDLEDSVNAQELKRLEDLSGKAAAIVPFSNFWGENYASRKQLDEIAGYGAAPLLRLMPWGEPYWEPFAYQPDYSLQKIINEDFDLFLSDWADQIKEFGKPVMITFEVEMNGNWFPWSGVFQGRGKTSGYGDPKKADRPEKYVDAYRYIIKLFRDREVSNVTWLFQPNRESYPDKQWNSLEVYYPGNNYID